MAALVPAYISTLTHGADAKKDIGRALVAWLGDKPAAKMTPAWAQGIVSQWQEHYSVASQRCRLSQFRAFFSWLVKAGELRSHPFAEIKVVGRANRGKSQLRISEAQRFTATAIQRFVDGDRFALAAVVALAMGLRSSEVLGLHARDVDDGGSVLWVMGTKSSNAQRHLRVPAVLRPLLVQVAAERGLTERIWEQKRSGFAKLVRRLCKEAGVPIVCPHSLRGLWATLAVESGQASEAVAAALGHGAFAMTAKHYAQPAAVHSAQTDRAGSVLFRNHSASVESDFSSSEKSNRHSIAERVL